MRTSLNNICHAWQPRIQDTLTGVIWRVGIWANGFYEGHWIAIQNCNRSLTGEYSSSAYRHVCVVFIRGCLHIMWSNLGPNQYPPPVCIYVCVCVISVWVCVHVHHQTLCNFISDDFKVTHKKKTFFKKKLLDQK